MITFSQMTFLNLERNEFGDEGAQHLAKCVHNISKLDLQYCKIGSNGVKALAQGINTRIEPVMFSIVS